MRLQAAAAALGKACAINVFLNLKFKIKKSDKTNEM